MRVRCSIMKTTIVLAGLGILGFGCSNPSHFGAPAMAPIVRAATPSALRPAATASLWTTMPRTMLAALSPVGTARAQAPLTVNEAIQAIFTDTYPAMSPTGVQGLINYNVVGVDDRMASVDGRGSHGSCLASTPNVHRIDLSSVASALDLTLDIQCTDTFQGGGAGMSGPGAGMVFGRQTASDGGGALGSSYSLWLHAGPAAATDQMAFFANVLHADTPDKSVDFLYLENSTSSSRISAFRVKAQPSTNTFEFAYASSSVVDPGGWYSKLHCGFRMISDGAFIWAEGTDLPMGQPCSAATPFTRCFDANTFSDVSSTTSCDALRTTFTMAAPTEAQVATGGDAFTAAMQIANAAGETTAF